MRGGPRRGFTLLEVLISLAVMVIALLGLVTVLVSGLKAQDKTSKSVVARGVAARVMDRLTNSLEAGDASDVEPFWDQDISTTEYDDGERGKEVVGATTFSYRINAVEIRRNGKPFGTATGYDGNRMKMVTVTVAWAADGSETRTGMGKQEIVISQLLNRSQP